MGIRCNGDDDLLSSCSIVDIDARDCPKVAGVICEGVMIMFLMSELRSLCVIIAPCLSKGLTDCNDCDSPSTCRPSLDCSCHPDCYERGSCCPDISHVENCVGKCNSLIFNKMWETILCQQFRSVKREKYD